jgi:hypothetical protein
VKIRTVLAAFFVVVLAATVGGQPSSTEKKPTSPMPDQLVEQLGDPDFRKRDQAAELLKTEGVKVLPTLRANLKHHDPEVRRRLMELIPNIEVTAQLAPKRVTLKAKDMALKDLMAELGKQTGYTYEFNHNNPEQKFSFDLNNRTFWETVDEINKQTGLDYQANYGDDRVRLYQQGGNSPYSYTDGAFRFSAVNFQLYKHVDLMQRNPGANRRSESLTFSFAVQSEPKLPMLGMGQPRVTAAFDNEKNSMLIPSNPNEGIEEFEGRRGRYYSRYGNGNRMWYMQTAVNLIRPSEKANGVKVLRGTIPITLLAEQKPHVVADNVLKGKGKKLTVGTSTITIEEANAIANTNQVSIKITFNEDTGGNPNDYSWQNSIYQRLEVQDAKGNKYQLYGTNWGNSNANSLQMTMTYAPMDQTKKPEGDVKLIFYEWKVMQHQLNFEFKDLPLP